METVVVTCLWRFPSFTWPYGGFDASRIQASPMDGSEKIMIHRSSNASHTKSSAWISLQQATHKGGRMRTKIRWNFQGSTLESSKELGTVRRVPWRQSRHHFIHQHTKTPIVHTKSMSRLTQDLRCHILWRSAHGGGSFTWMLNFVLCQTKITQFHMTLCIQQHIFRFQITINDSSFVQMAHCQNEFRRVKSGYPFRKSSIPRQVEKQFSTGAIIQNQVQFVLRLKGKMKLHDKRMVHDR
mmetsp:Transcript_24716/g.44767  ORF Transcript_24716/g.44767 Transcript_24716/m.44767 type:complete len:240 (+) Transcript_24716:420-1139(+)